MMDMHPELARAVLDELPTGLVLLDDTRRIVWANQTMGAIVNQTVAELTGQNAAALPLPLPEEDGNSIGPRVQERGRLVGIAYNMVTSQFNGRALLVIDRGQTSFSLLNAMPVGPGGVPMNIGSIVSAEAIRYRLEVEISRSRRYGNPLSCLIVRFTQVAADETEPTVEAAFRETARIVKEQLRWVDVLGQWTQDAIMIVLPETNAAAANGLAEKLLHAMRTSWSEDLPRVEVSCGTGTWKKGDDVERVVTRAVTATLENGMTEAAGS